MPKSHVGPVDFLFLDNDFGTYSGSFDAIEPRLSEEATVVADNAGIEAEAMDRYLSPVRARFRGECRWFRTSLPWASRDAMEITEFRPRCPSAEGVNQNGPKPRPLPSVSGYGAPPST